MTGLPAAPLRPPALVVHAYPSPHPLGDRLRGAAVSALGPRYTTAVVDVASGYRPAMSREEWDAYETDRPLVDPEVAAHASLVVRARVLVFVYPSVWFGLPGAVKGWLDRTLVPGVAFSLGSDGRVRPRLGELRAIGGVTTYRQTASAVRRAGDGGRRTLLRALRLNAPGRVRTRWLGLPAVDGVSPAGVDGFVGRVGRELGKL